uniref:MANSC domain-containing protein n=1 Tax=Strigamia maritima TaxID=126957 RepID=T1J182_STRMM
MAVFPLSFIYLSVLFATASLGIAREKRSSRRILPQPQDDVSVCLNDFQVSDTTIIRTQDSRQMGAKYLNETEMPSKEECMKWCCDTYKCNVAVYEEKNKGSCYIFDCSPMGDFKCRFTAHEHYTSAVLRVNRHSYDLDKWGTEAKHEEELSRLRDEETTTNPTPPTIVSTTTAPTTMITQPTTIGPTQIAPTSFVSPISAEKKTSGERHCSRFQFECRNTSECIAIYNACDGIPQCSDASDESVELGCPMDIPRRTSNDGYKLKTVNEGQPSLPDQVNLEPIRGVPTQTNNNNYNQYMAKQLQHQHQQEQFPKKHFDVKTINENNLPTSVFAHKNGGFLPSQSNYETQLSNSNYKRPVQQTRGPYMKSYSQGNADDSPEMAQEPYSDQNYDNSGLPQREAWPRNKDNFNTYPRPRVSVDHRTSDVAQSHSHARYDNRGQENRASAAQMEQYYPSPVKDYSNRGSYQESSAMKPMSKIPVNAHFEEYANNKQTWPDEKGKQGLQQKVEGLAIRLGIIYLVEEKMEWVPWGKTALIKFKKEDGGKTALSEHVFSTDVQMYPIDTSDKKNIKSKSEDSAKLQADVKQALQAITTSTTILPTETITSVYIAQETHSHSQLNKEQVNLAEADVQNLQHQNEANGAVVALTLGLTLTGVLVVLVGCRLRVVRRHLRRGRSPFTHDADYLVNGMYL